MAFVGVPVGVSSFTDASRRVGVTTKPRPNVVRVSFECVWIVVDGGGRILKMFVFDLISGMGCRR